MSERDLVGSHVYFSPIRPWGSLGNSEREYLWGMHHHKTRDSGEKQSQEKIYFSYIPEDVGEGNLGVSKTGKFFFFFLNPNIFHLNHPKITWFTSQCQYKAPMGDRNLQSAVKTGSCWTVIKADTIDILLFCSDDI